MYIHSLSLLLIITCTVSSSALAQQKEKAAKPDDMDHIFTKVEINAGTNEQDWYKYIQANTVLPDSATHNIPANTYKVLISFIIDTEGKLQDVKVVNDPGYGLGERALKIFNGYKGKWRPANQCGRTVKSYEKRPIIFVVAG